MNFWSRQGSLAFPEPIGIDVSVTQGRQRNTEYSKNQAEIFIS